MARITSLERSEPTPILRYTRVVPGCACPGGMFAGHRICGCDGCRGIAGDCWHAVSEDRVVVRFALDDGRRGGVVVALNATDGEIGAAIATWSGLRPARPDPLIGTLIP